jgi:hypothetical protein
MRVLALIMLTACAASPEPGMIGAQSQMVQVNGRTYTVWWTTEDFEIIRHGWASPGEHQQIRADMLALVPQVTGCPMLNGAIIGDSGEIHGPLTC